MGSAGLAKMFRTKATMAVTAQAPGTVEGKQAVTC
jgi:hypothetical protein